MVDATLAGQFDVVADLTLPGIVELSGGRDRVIEVMRAEFSDSQDPKLVAMSPSAPLPLRAFAKYHITFVPTATTVSSGTMRVRTHTHMLAVSTDQGLTWHFMSGHKISHDRIRVFIPEFPSSIEIPRNKPPELLSR